MDETKRQLLEWIDSDRDRLITFLSQFEELDRNTARASFWIPFPAAPLRSATVGFPE
jgi:hypothetical protein